MDRLSEQDLIHAALAGDRNAAAGLVQAHQASLYAFMYAIIEESGGQRKVSQDEEILIDLYKGGEASKGDSITFDRVLVIGDAGGSAKVGTPLVGGATVTAEIVEPVVKGEKLDIHKIRPKKGYRRKTGHRQRYTLVKVTGLKG